MLEPKDLADAFARNTMLLRQQAEGLTNTDSLLQLPFRGNCLNWVLGHIVGNRDDVLEALGAPPVMSGAIYEPYRRGSEPVTSDGEHVQPLEDLLGLLDRSQEQLAAALARTTDADMAREMIRGDRKTTLAKRVFFLYFHETYHVGQTELLRQLTGVNDQVI